MNLKKKLFGFGAAAVLSLGIVSGAMAQTTVDQGNNVNLVDGGTCTVRANVFQGPGTNDFGEFEWTGSEYTGGDTALMGVTTLNSTKEADCGFQVSATSFLGFGGNSGEFDTTISYAMPGQDTVNVETSGAAVRVGDIPRGPNDITEDHELNILSVPAEATPGKYRTTVSYTAVSGQ